MHKLDNKKIFGPSGGATISGWDKEIEEIFGGGMQSEEEDDDDRYVFMSFVIVYFLTNLK